MRRGPQPGSAPAARPPQRQLGRHHDGERRPEPAPTAWRQRSPWPAAGAPQAPRARHAEPAPHPGAAAGAALPADPAQRERALLLRAFESSPLSKANFCALKGIDAAALDAALVQAKAERGPSKA